MSGLFLTAAGQAAGDRGGKMKPIFTIILGLTIGIGAGGLLLMQHQHFASENPSKHPAKTRSSVSSKMAKIFQATIQNGIQLVKEGSSPSLKQGQAILANVAATPGIEPWNGKALGILRLVQNTGATEGSREWKSIIGDGTRVVCGANTTESYILVSAANGIEKHSNPPPAEWEKARCYDSSPRMQHIVQLWIDYAKRRLESLVRDPDGTRYREIRAMRNLGTGKIEICGEVNPPNGLGGYNGYTRFIASDSELVTEIGDDTGSWGVVAESRWPQECKIGKFAEALSTSG